MSKQHRKDERLLADMLAEWIAERERGRRRKPRKIAAGRQRLDLWPELEERVKAERQSHFAR